ncbi:chitin synthase [Malassezia sp. CBS 17886]|nr:chitin synthase [Malassezia sp. CBS 17886]
MAAAHNAAQPCDLAALREGGQRTDEKAITAALCERYGHGKYYTWASPSTLVSVNAYREDSAADAAAAETATPHHDLPAAAPHPYVLAARVFHRMLRAQRSQSIVYSGVSDAGKSHTMALVTDHLLHLAAGRTAREAHLADQVRCARHILGAFGTAQTVANREASRHATYWELHFTPNGRLAGAKVLTLGLDKHRVRNLEPGERAYHVFYQLLAGATPDERAAYRLAETPAPALLAPGGVKTAPGRDDARAWDWTRSALRTLGMKEKHIQGILRVLAAVVHLSDVAFADGRGTGHAHVADRAPLQRAADVLQVPSAELEQSLVMDTAPVGRDRATQMLDAGGAQRQCAGLAHNLYALLFAFLVEAVNQKLSPGADELLPLHIVQLDTPGFQATRGDDARPRHFDDFLKNYAAELVGFWQARDALDAASPANHALLLDGLPVPAVPPSAYAETLQLLRGDTESVPADGDAGEPDGLLGDLARAFHLVQCGARSEGDDAALVRDMDRHYKHRAFIPGDPRAAARGCAAFDVNHRLGPAHYTVAQLQHTELDQLPALQYELLRHAQCPFVARLFAGPGLALESQGAGDGGVARTQVSSRPLRHATALDRSTRVAWPDAGALAGVSRQLDTSLLAMLRTLHSADMCWHVLCLRANDISQPHALDTRRVAKQVKAYLLPLLLARAPCQTAHTMPLDEFCARYDRVLTVALGQMPADCDPRARFDAFAARRSWGPAQFSLGDAHVALSYAAWFEMEEARGGGGARRVGALGGGAVDAAAGGTAPAPGAATTRGTAPADASPPPRPWHPPRTPPTNPFVRASPPRIGPGVGGYGADDADGASERSLLHAYEDGAPHAYGGGPPHTYEGNPPHAYGGGPPHAYEGDPLHAYEDAPLHPHEDNANDAYARTAWPGVAAAYTDVGALEKDTLLEPVEVEEVPVTSVRKWWARTVGAMTYPVPESLLTRTLGMTRPDVRMAWREKVAICMLIFLLCAAILFYIIGVGLIACPDRKSAYNAGQLSEHGDGKSFYVAVQGVVYDITKFYRLDHSDIPAVPASSDAMEQLAGKDLTPYFPVPLAAACPNLVSDRGLQLAQTTNLSGSLGQAMHVSGPAQTHRNTKLDSAGWYYGRFLPKMAQYRKGVFVYDPKDIAAQGSWRTWAVVGGKVYDLTNYVHTQKMHAGDAKYAFLDQDLVDVFSAQAGADVTHDVQAALARMDAPHRGDTQTCLDRAFYVGKADFRLQARCQVQDYLLLSFSVLIFVSIFAKFVSALQLARRPTPEQQDRFVICHVPCYTEDEDSLRKTLESIAEQQYDDKRKLLFIVCDGMITGRGNERPTPRIVLDILGVAPGVDPEPLPFKSVAEGSKQLNYGKVYSGLFECEGHVVPYVVVVKVGRPSERSRPGNRGKRDTQILLMRYLNRVHFDAPMFPLELELYHHMKNVIGIDPSFYEFVLMVDADTSIANEGLNRLVAAACHDRTAIAVCGETLLDNAESSWWTMIQVYEYYISHNLAKAFESLFGSVTCLPGCFTMYRVRSADKGRPLFISDRIIDDYSENRVDTLHKKNLLALGEDRYLTTLLLKHFPSFRTKYHNDASAHTAAPDSIAVLMSQRRRWINSTVHNLVELVKMKGLCGFCLFSMRFIVFIDLLGTIILPATAVYMVYLIITVATGSSPLPVIAIAMIAAVYGLQAIVFLLKRQWQYIGWMVIYLIAFPIYAFVLPIYSFWHMDDFSWGNTRIVVGEKGNMKVVAGTDDEPYSDAMIPRKRYTEYQQEIYATGDLPSEPLYTAPLDHAPRPPRAAEQYADPADDEYGADYFQSTNVLKGNRLSHASSGAGSGSWAPPPAWPLADPRASAAPSMYGMPSSLSMYGMPHMPMYGLPPWGAGVAAPEDPAVAHWSMPAYGMPRPVSAASVPGVADDPFAAGYGSAPSLDTDSTNPSDAQIRAAVQSYLAAQPSLMNVTKRHVREAVTAAFPNAALDSRRARINQMTDELLAG